MPCMYLYLCCPSLSIFVYIGVLGVRIMLHARRFTVRRGIVYTSLHFSFHRVLYCAICNWCLLLLRLNCMAGMIYCIPPSYMRDHGSSNFLPTPLLQKVSMSCPSSTLSPNYYSVPISQAFQVISVERAPGDPPPPVYSTLEWLVRGLC